MAEATISLGDISYVLTIKQYRVAHDEEGKLCFVEVM
jgi:hypothetical protein